MTAGTDRWPGSWLEIERAIGGMGKNMPPWFNRGQTPDKWAERLDPRACASMRDTIVRAMIKAKRDGHHNLAGDLLILLVAVDGRAK